MNSNTNKIDQLEFEKLKINKFRIRYEIIKWLIGGVIIISGFLMIRLREQDRLDKHLIVELVKDYFESAETIDIELWQRKLDLMKTVFFKENAEFQSFLKREQTRLEKFNHYGLKVHRIFYD